MHPLCRAGLSESSEAARATADLPLSRAHHRSLVSLLCAVVRPLQVDPVIAYYARLYALQLGMKTTGKTPADLKLIGEQMSWVENHQSAIKGLSKEDARARCEAFALQVFEHGDTEDRAGLATKKTALNFHAAYVLLDLCRQFGELASDVEEKLRYAIVKAADINKALKEGRKPKAGPLNEPDMNEDEELAALGMPVGGSSSSSSSSAATGPPHFGTASAPFTGGAPNWPSASTSSSNPAFNPRASPPQQPAETSSAFPFIHDSSSSASVPVTGVDSFMGDAPHLPTPLPGQQQQQPQQQQPPASAAAAFFDKRNAAAGASARPSAASASPPGASHGATNQPSPFSASASAARAAAAAAAGNSGGAFSKRDTRKMDAVREGERLIKHALSAVVFSDVDTTVLKLKEALALLQPFTTTGH